MYDIPILNSKRSFDNAFDYANIHGHHDPKRHRMLPPAPPLSLVAHPSYSPEKPERRRVNPEALSARLGPEIVAALDALVTPGQTEMPSYAERKSIQQRFNLDRRHIYDYYHSKGLRVVKEDKGHRHFAALAPLTDRQLSIEELAERHGLRPGGGRKEPSPITSAPVFAQVCAPPFTTQPISSTNQPTTQNTYQSDSFQASGSGSQSSIASSPSSFAQPPAPFDDLSLSLSPYLSITNNSPLALPPTDKPLNFGTFYNHASVDEDSVYVPPPPDLSDLEPLMSPSDTQDTLMFSPEHIGLSRQEREEAYLFLSYAVGPASGIQESAGTYKSFMKNQKRHYFSNLSDRQSSSPSEPPSESIAVHPAHSPAPVASCSLFGEQARKCSQEEDFKKWLMPPRHCTMRLQEPEDTSSESDTSLGSIDQQLLTFITEHCSMSSDTSTYGTDTPDTSLSFEGKANSQATSNLFEQQPEPNVAAQKQPAYYVYDIYGARNSTPDPLVQVPSRRHLPFYNSIPMSIQRAPPLDVPATSGHDIIHQIPPIIAQQPLNIDHQIYAPHGVVGAEHVSVWDMHEATFISSDPNNVHQDQHSIVQQLPQSTPHTMFIDAEFQPMSHQFQISLPVMAEAAQLYPTTPADFGVPNESCRPELMMPAPIPTQVNIDWLGVEHLRPQRGRFHLISGER